MNDDETNPFAASPARPATVSPFSNQRASDYNPFTNTTTPAQPVSPSQQSGTAAVLPSAQLPAYQPSAYTPVPTPVAVPQPTSQYASDIKPTSTFVDLGQHDQRQTDLDEREKRLAERERALANPESATARINNFPPLPKFCPCRPCFYQDINVDIPSQFQRWVRYLFYVWLFYSLTLFLNMIATLAYFLTDASKGGSQFGLALVYLVLFIPASYFLWFRPIYRAFRVDSSVFFMCFFVIDVMQIATTVLAAIGIIPGLCGITGISLLSDNNKVVGTMMIVLGVLWALISFATIVLTIRIHQLYRRSGASLEEAQKEFQTAIVNSPTVRGAARGVATAGVNAALSNN
jgi:hypothetical protein